MGLNIEWDYTPNKRMDRKPPSDNPRAPNIHKQKREEKLAGVINFWLGYWRV